jgi:glycosyltransferase involved in cell wall biosynthesis
MRQKLADAGASTAIVNYDWWCHGDPPTREEITARLDRSFEAVLQQTKEHLVQIDPDVVVTNTLVIPWGAIAASLLDKPHVWSIREFGELDHGLKFDLPFAGVLDIIRTSSNRILTNSNAVKSALFGDSPDAKVTPIHSCVRIPPDSLAPGTEASYFRRSGAIKLAISGRITESKGQKDAILAVGELVRRRRNVELLIQGEASPAYLDELTKTMKARNLEEYVKFFDFTENPYPLLNQADVVLLCSKNEAFARVVIEAMLLRKAVIGTRTGGTPELIRDGVNGFLYQPGDHQQLAERIAYLMDHHELGTELGKNGFNMVRRSFTTKKYGGKVHRLLVTLKGKPNPLSSAYFRFLKTRLLELWEESANRQRLLRIELEQVRTMNSTQERYLGEKASEVSRLTLEGARLTGEVSELQNALAKLKAEQESISCEALSLQARVRDQEWVIGEKEEELNQLLDVREALEQSLDRLTPFQNWKPETVRSVGKRERLTEDVARLNAALAELEEEFGRRGEAVRKAEKERHRLIQEVNQLEAALARDREKLSEIYTSLGWRVLVIYRALKVALLGADTRRRRAYDHALKGMKVLVLGRKSSSSEGRK